MEDSPSLPLFYTFSHLRAACKGLMVLFAHVVTDWKGTGEIAVGKIAHPCFRISYVDGRVRTRGRRGRSSYAPCPLRASPHKPMAMSAIWKSPCVEGFLQESGVGVAREFLGDCFGPSSATRVPRNTGPVPPASKEPRRDRGRGPDERYVAARRPRTGFSPKRSTCE